MHYLAMWIVSILGVVNRIKCDFTHTNTGSGQCRFCCMFFIWKRGCRRQISHEGCLLQSAVQLVLITWRDDELMQRLSDGLQGGWMGTDWSVLWSECLHCKCVRVQFFPPSFVRRDSVVIYRPTKQSNQRQHSSLSPPRHCSLHICISADNNHSCCCWRIFFLNNKIKYEKQLRDIWALFRYSK